MLILALRGYLGLLWSSRRGEHNPIRFTSLDWLRRGERLRLSDQFSEADMIDMIDMRRRSANGAPDLAGAEDDDADDGDAGHDDEIEDGDLGLGKNTADAVHRLLVRIGAASVVAGRLTPVPSNLLPEAARQLLLRGARASRASHRRVPVGV